MYKTRYLKGLDTLRALTAIVVVWSHIEQLKLNNSFSSASEKTFNLPSAHIGVVFFFVIGGFLITYLLVNERNNTGSISLKKILYATGFKNMAVILLHFIAVLLFISS